MRGTAQHSGSNSVVVDPRMHRACSYAEVSGLDADVALTPLLGFELLPVDDSAGPLRRRGKLRVGERAFEVPLVPAVNVDDRPREPHHAQSWEVRVHVLGPGAESEDVEALSAGHERVGFPFCQMDEAVARPDLERQVLVALPLPRKARAAEYEENFLVTLRVKRRRALADLDADP